MHSVTAGSLWPVFNSVPWIDDKMKCRLLEWKGRADLMLYCQSGLPDQRPDELTAYRPRSPSGWADVYRRACDYQDDGHLVKFIRGIATAYQISRPFVTRAHFPLQTGEQFLQVAHMGECNEASSARFPRVISHLNSSILVIDSAEQFNAESAEQETEMICAKYEYPRIMSPEIQRVTARWPRHVGFEEAWFHVPARKPRNLPVVHL